MTWDTCTAHNAPAEPGDGYCFAWLLEGEFSSDPIADCAIQRFNRWAAFTDDELHWTHWALTALNEHIVANDARLTGLPPRPITEGRGPEWTAEIEAELARRRESVA